VAFLLAATGLLVWAAGCGHDSPTTVKGEVATQPVSGMAGASEHSGAQLWSANCSRCHNLRPPQSYSDAQWALIVHHMRLRANLTGQEARSITEFLQASN
jgi:cytochrome c5